MRMWDLLQERVSPSRLYHWTDRIKLANIFHTNTLKAMKSHFGDEAGVSFSRVPTATGISDHKPLVMVLDRNRVAQNHKLIPRYGDIQKAADYAQSQGGFEPVDVRKETEEMVPNDVEPLDRYLTHIVVTQDQFDYMVQGWILKQLKRHHTFWPQEAIEVMDWIVQHPNVGVLVANDLRAAWTRALDTHSVYPGQFKHEDWQRLWDESEDRRLSR